MRSAASNRLKCHTARLFLAAVVYCVGFATTSPAHAWGREGHRITGYVAESLLTPEARIRLHRLTEGATLDQLATYMDDRKQELGPRIRRWHYENAPVCRSDTVDSYCRNGDCASRQIERLISVLRSPSSTIEQKRQAVVFLSHLIGDIHQPLHAADNLDKGGNEIVIVDERSHGYYRKNLHSEWDSTFVKAVVRGHNEADFAEQLVREGSSQIPAIEKGSPADWLRESHRIAQDFAYGRLPTFRCGAALSSTTITPEYAREAHRIVREQLLKAGARMAAVFNSAFSGMPPPD